MRINGPFDAVGRQGRKFGPRREFGLYRSDGEVVPDCDIRAGQFTTLSAFDPPGDEQIAEFDRPVLFAGLAPRQFGHVILNSLGRLWALDDLPPDVGLLFLPSRNAGMSAFPYLKPLLGLLGVETDVYLHRQTTRYHQLYTARDLFGERFGGGMEPAMRDWFLNRLPPGGAVTAGRKVYFTRTRLGPKVGRFCNEPLLESLLEKDGYEIVAPERLSLKEQVAVMQDAEVLLFAESSALHLYGLVARGGQQAAVIQRRRTLLPLITGQFRDAPTELSLIDAIEDIRWPPKRADNRSIAILDFERLRDALSAQGFLSSGAEWRCPAVSEVSASLHMGQDVGETFVPDAERRDWLRAYKQSIRLGKRPATE